MCSIQLFASQLLTETLLYLRFADIVTDDCARLKADVTRYIIIAVDSQRLLLAVSRRTGTKAALFAYE